jgi:hypothetical protein
MVTEYTENITWKYNNVTWYPENTIHKTWYPENLFTHLETGANTHKSAW